MESYWKDYEATKPRVKLENWYVTPDIIRETYKAPEQVNRVIFGQAYGHPNFKDGDKIYTSPIVSTNGKIIETRNTTYLLGQIDPAYLTWCQENNITFDTDNPIQLTTDFYD